MGQQETDVSLLGTIIEKQELGNEGKKSDTPTEGKVGPPLSLEDRTTGFRNGQSSRRVRRVFVLHTANLGSIDLQDLVRSPEPVRVISKCRAE